MMWNSTAFFRVYNNDNTSTCRELKAVARYFYGNWIMHVFNKLCTFESTALLKLLKRRLWLPVSICKAMIMASHTEAVKHDESYLLTVYPKLEHQSILLLTTCDSTVPQLCQIDLSKWGLLSDLTREILTFVKISQIKTNLLKTHLKIPKTKNLNLCMT